MAYKANENHSSMTSVEQKETQDFYVTLWPQKDVFSYQIYE